MEKYFKKIGPIEITAETDTIEVDNLSSCSDLNQEHLPSKRKRMNTYIKNWEDDDDCKLWLCKSENSLQAYCKVCSIELKTAGGITDLKRHAKSVKHVAKSNAIQMHSQIKSSFINRNDQVAKTEIQLSAFCAEHNISFLTMDHLIPVLKDAIPDSEIVKKLSCSRTKTTAVIKNVIGASQLDDLCALMRSNYFSICLDESTDISTTKLLSIVVRTQQNGRILDFFFVLLKIQVCDAESIYAKIINVFSEKKIDYKYYLVGLAADGANVMTGSNHSVATLLKKDCPNLVVFKCTCHSVALCANHACSLSKYVESCARDIYNFIQNSPKRIELFSDLQALLDYKPKKMLHPSQTRWLSLEQTVIQILSRFDVLRLFFVHEDIEKFDSVHRINACFKKKQFELYLKFLKFVLNDINKLNKLFQSESPQLHRVYTEVKRVFFKILQYFIKEEHINDENLTDSSLLNNDEFMLDLKNIYLGADIEAALISSHILSDEDETEFRSHCLTFFIELSKHLMKKFDFNDNLLQTLANISPINIINKTNISCTNLMMFFPQIIIKDEYQEIDDEWREVRLLDFPGLKLSHTMEVDIFWQNIFELKRVDGSECFPKLKKFILVILTIPVATANVERIFSQINLNKTKIRNSLLPSTLSGILHTKDFLKKNQQNCTNFKPTQKMYQKFNTEMYRS